MIRIGDFHTLCSDCGDFCDDCGDRMCATNGPAPLPRCYEHPTCDLHDGPVWCTECLIVLADHARDRADQAAYDVAREGLS